MESFDKLTPEECHEILRKAYEHDADLLMDCLFESNDEDNSQK